MREEISVTQVCSEMPHSRRFQPRLVKYGLPCARCRAYYPSALPACPVCQCGERVSPTLAVVVPQCVICTLPGEE
jgi:hypothetical protein